MAIIPILMVQILNTVVLRTQSNHKKVFICLLGIDIFCRAGIQTLYHLENSFKDIFFSLFGFSRQAFSVTMEPGLELTL